jgi:tetratricopeptide (TPR) repeat protein
MIVLHNSILKLTERLLRFLPLPVVIAAVTFSATLSQCAYPGSSAGFIANAAGLSQDSTHFYPLFTFIGRQVASIEFLTLPLRLNLISTICGTICATLLYYLIARLILFSACEGDNELQMGFEPQISDDFIADLPPDVIKHNERIFKIAVTGGLTAALALIFSTAGWIASTRFDPAIIHLLIGLLAITLFPSSHAKYRSTRIFLSALLFTIGMLESVVFVLAMPVLLFFIFKLLLYDPLRKTHSTMISVAMAVAMLVSIAIYRSNISAAPPETIQTLLKLYASELVTSHLREITAFFTVRGWIPLMVQSFVPILIILFAMSTLFKEKRIATVVLLILLTAVTVPGMLNLSAFAPIFLLRSGLAVFSHVIIAAALGVTLAASLTQIGGDDLQYEVGPDDFIQYRQFIQAKCIQFFAIITLAVAISITLCAPCRAFKWVNPKNGIFADQIAHLILDAMEDCNVLISNGLIDNHIKIAARHRRKPLTVLPLNPDLDRETYDYLHNLINTSTIYEGLNRTRLRNALSIGTVQFITEWLKMESEPEGKIMIFSTPEIWSSCDHQPVPHGMLFGALKSGQKPDPAAIFKRGSAFVSKIIPLLSAIEDEPPQSAYIRKLLRIKSSFAVNELGILLEELDHPELAYTAYSNALKIESDNVSAAINRHALNIRHKYQPERYDTMKKQIDAALVKARQDNLNTLNLLQTYGTIRQSDFYLKQRELWMRRGIKSIADQKGNKALALSQRGDSAELRKKSVLQMTSDEIEDAVEFYQAVLDVTPDNLAAHRGLCAIAIKAGDIAHAELYIENALAGGVDADELRYEMICLEMLRKNSDKALELLKEATKVYPQDLRYWTMLCELLLEIGDTQLVEYQVLPKMRKILNQSSHFLVHAIYGELLRSKGPEHYCQARVAYLQALNLNASMPDLWQELLELDMLINNRDFIRNDAATLLKIEPDHALANYLLGSDLLAAGRVMQSEDFLRRSVISKPTAMAYNDLAENLRLQKKLEEAENMARQALDITPDFLPALDTLACILYDQGNYKQAIAVSQRATTIKPEHTTYQLTLLKAQIKTGDKQGVLRRLAALTALNSDLPADIREEIRLLMQSSASGEVIRPAGR